MFSSPGGRVSAAQEVDRLLDRAGAAGHEPVVAVHLDGRANPARPLDERAAGKPVPFGAGVLAPDRVDPTRDGRQVHGSGPEHPDGGSATTDPVEGLGQMWVV